MEFILELLFEIFGEALLQLVFELLAELGVRRLGKGQRRPSPALAIVGYGVLGALAGGCSLWLKPVLFIASPTAQVVNLVLTPLLIGGLMAQLGAWRQRRDKATVRLDRFTYAYVFALGMALVRYAFGH
jgi:hypothetical protein